MADSCTKKCIFVLGLRSGTSLVTRTLSHMGGNIPGKQLGPAFDNPDGFFEPLRVLDYNERLLRRSGQRWSDLDLEVDFPSDTPESLLEGDSPILIKDPRICRFVKIWIMGCIKANISPVFVLCMRNPNAVAQSLLRRDGIPERKGRLLYKEYMRCSLTDTNNYKRFFLTYEDFIDNPVKALKDINIHLGIDLGEVPNFVKPELNHYVDMPHLSTS